MTSPSSPRILSVQASGRGAESVSRTLSAELIDALKKRTGATAIRERDLAAGLPFVDERWIEANFTAPDERDREQRDQLARSDALVQELADADLLVIGVPIYNFSVPAALKAWVDMVARARLTFRYTENGPEGLLKGKRAFLVVASGGVPVDSDADFATPYMRHALAFLGIDDVSVIAAERLNFNADGALTNARQQIARLIRQLSSAASKAA